MNEPTSPESTVRKSLKPYLISAGVAVGALALALALFFLGFFVRDWVDVPVELSPTPTPTPIVSVDDDPARGPENAPVTIIEFSDFQCPYCRRYVNETYPLILSTYGNQVHYVFRDFPIASHLQAQKAAEAAQCAFEQGKFWEYHDILFQNQGALDVPNLKSYAAALGLDQSAFNQCLDSGKYTEEVQADFNDGLSYGVTAVPTFFINGHKVVGAKPFSTFQSVIEDELAEAGAL